jgi:iron(III) transport system substrate-binding protein
MKPVWMVVTLFLTLVGCGGSDRPEVVVYVSHDQVFSEPILKDFEKETGVRVKAVFDTEEAKSTGVMNRLLSEKGNPQADVYWANEPVRAEALRQQGITSPYISSNSTGIAAGFKDPEGHWTGFAARARVIVVHSKIGEKVAGISDYVDSKWKGKAVMANPLFGTTTAQVAALFTLWGDEKTKGFLSKVKENGVRISSSNGESTHLVASGSYSWALVDTDDAVSGSRQGKPIQMVYPDQGKDDPGCFIIPNAVLLVSGGPHPGNGKKLIDYLLSKETERKLAFADSAQIPLHEGVETPKDLKRIEEIKAMKVDYRAVAKKLQEIQPFLKEWVGR